MKTIMKRLNKFLAECGVDSRRKCDLIIQSGRVAVNGIVAPSTGQMIDEEKDEVTVDGKRVFSVEKLRYILLYKPKGYVTTVSDELNRKTVMSLLPQNERLFPVGRLDKDTTGALLFTNDGDLAYQLTHPRFNVEKTYQVKVSRPLKNDHLKKLESGIMLDDGVTRTCRVRLLEKSNREIEMILKEGRKREIKRMLLALGYQVLELKRVKFAFITLTGLKPGQWRYLKQKEIAN